MCYVLSELPATTEMTKTGFHIVCTLNFTARHVVCHRTSDIVEKLVASYGKSVWKNGGTQIMRHYTFHPRLDSLLLTYKFCLAQYTAKVILFCGRTTKVTVDAMSPTAAAQGCADSRVDPRRKPSSPDHSATLICTSLDNRYYPSKYFVIQATEHASGSRRRLSIWTWYYIYTWYELQQTTTSYSGLGHLILLIV